MRGVGACNCPRPDHSYDPRQLPPGSSALPWCRATVLDSAEAAGESGTVEGVQGGGVLI
jgi:hypothetical protein